MKFLLLFFITLELFAASKNLYILDAKTFNPIVGAIISDQNTSIKSDKNGWGHISTPNQTLFIKACGYKQKSVDADAKTVFLEPFTSKALYVSFWAAGSTKYMRRILELTRTTEINTVSLMLRMNLVTSHMKLMSSLQKILVHINKEPLKILTGLLRY